MHPTFKPLRVVFLGLALLAATGPAFDGLRFSPEPLQAAHAMKLLGGADKIGWARKYRDWCKENTDEDSCTYVNAIKYPRCVNTAVKHFKNACSIHR